MQQSNLGSHLAQFIIAVGMAFVIICGINLNQVQAQTSGLAWTDVNGNGVYDSGTDTLGNECGGDLFLGPEISCDYDSQSQLCSCEEISIDIGSNCGACDLFAQCDGTEGYSCSTISITNPLQVSWTDQYEVKPWKTWQAHTWDDNKVGVEVIPFDDSGRALTIWSAVKDGGVSTTGDGYIDHANIQVDLTTGLGFENAGYTDNCMGTPGTGEISNEVSVAVTTQTEGVFDRFAKAALGPKSGGNQEVVIVFNRQTFALTSSSPPYPTGTHTRTATGSVPHGLFYDDISSTPNASDSSLYAVLVTIDEDCGVVSTGTPFEVSASTDRVGLHPGRVFYDSDDDVYVTAYEAVGSSSSDLVLVVFDYSGNSDTVVLESGADVEDYTWKLQRRLGTTKYVTSWSYENGSGYKESRFREDTITITTSPSLSVSATTSSSPVTVTITANAYRNGHVFGLDTFIPSSSSCIYVLGRDSYGVDDPGDLSSGCYSVSASSWTYAYDEGPTSGHSFGWGEPHDHMFMNGATSDAMWIVAQRQNAVYMERMDPSNSRDVSCSTVTVVADGYDYSAQKMNEGGTFAGAVLTDGAYSRLFPVFVGLGATSYDGGGSDWKAASQVNSKPELCPQSGTCP